MDHLPAFFRQHIRRQHVAARESAYSNLEPAAFCQALVDRLDPASELRFSVLELDGRPVAYHLGFQINGKYFYYKPTFDIDLWDHSPGQILLYELLRTAGEVDVREFDFCQGGEPYKYRFANLIRQNHTYVVYPQGPAAELRRTLAHSLAAAKTRLERRPTVKGRLLNILDAARSVKARAHAHGWRGLVAACKHCVRTTILDWDYLISSECLPAALENDPADPNYRVEPGSLGRLADFAREAGVVDASRLRAARERLKRGDPAYLVTNNGSLTHVVWVAAAGNLQDNDLIRRLRPSNTALVVYDCWTGCGCKPMIHPVALAEILAAARKADVSTWILSPADRHSRAILTRFRAQPRYRWISMELLRRWTFSRLTALVNR